jgi:hypothetical protein
MCRQRQIKHGAFCREKASQRVPSEAASEAAAETQPLREAKLLEPRKDLAL